MQVSFRNFIWVIQTQAIFFFLLYSRKINESSTPFHCLKAIYHFSIKRLITNKKIKIIQTMALTLIYFNTWLDNVILQFSNSGVVIEGFCLLKLEFSVFNNTVVLLQFKILTINFLSSMTKITKETRLSCDFCRLTDNYMALWVSQPPR